MMGHAAEMATLARKCWGEPTHSTRDELRFGAHGSKTVRPKEAIFFDHETGKGGGYDDLYEKVHGHRPVRENQAEAIYDYRAADGGLLFQVVRKVPKTFRQRRPDGRSGWIWDLKNVERVPYRLPELLAADPGELVFVTEGEKDVEALRARGLVATCNPGGAGKWMPSLSQHLRGRAVVILPDNDEAGANHARDVAGKLKGIARSVRVVALAGLPPKGDVSDWLASGGTAEELTRLARDLAEQAPSPRAFRLIRPEECEALEPRPYVIKGLVGQGDVAVLIGQPGSGKSVIAPHLAYAVAQGREVLGRRVRGGPVVYVAAEDGHGMIGRVRALRRRWGDAPDFLLIPEPIDMMNPDGQEWQDLSGLVREVRPALIVIDTLARSFPGLRENEAEDMGRVVRAARDLAALTESAVLVVHHVAKESGGTPRGHGCLNGDADVTILVEGGGRDVRSVRLGKNRNGPSDATFAFNVAVEALGTDADGDPITAPIAEEADARTARTAGKVSALSGSQRTALEMLRRAVIDDGEPSPSRDIPAGVRAVRAETWRRYCYDGTISAGGTQDAKRKAFKRAADDLQARGLIGVWGELVWLAERPDPDSRTGPDKTGQRPDMSGPQEDTTRTDTDRGLSPVRCPGPVRGVLQ